MTFGTSDELTLHFGDYVNWFTEVRIHQTLGYLSPLQYKEIPLKKLVERCWQSILLPS